MRRLTSALVLDLRFSNTATAVQQEIIMIKTATFAVLGGVVSLPFSTTMALLAAIVASAAIIANARRQARGF